MTSRMRMSSLLGLAASLTAALVLVGCEDNTGATASKPAAKPAAATSDQPIKVEEVKPSDLTATPVGQPPRQEGLPPPYEPADPKAVVVKAEPALIEYGDIPTSDISTQTLKLVNTLDRPMVLTTHKVTCGCTALDIKPNTIIPALGELPVKVQLNGGKIAGPIHGKRVTFIIEEGRHPNVEVELKANAVNYVVMEPAGFGPDDYPDGKFKLRSIDGTPFKVMSMMPAAITEFAPEAKAEHELVMDWAKFREIGIQPQVRFFLDHPKAPELFTNVAFSPEEMAAHQAEQRKNAGINTPAIQQPTPAPPATPEALIAQLIKDGKTDEVMEKIDSGVDVNLRDRAGVTLLSVASGAGNVEMMRKLLDAGADIEAADNVGRTPLMHAAQSKNVEAVRALLDRGASVSVRDTVVGTALTWAAGVGDAATVKELLAAGAEAEVVAGPMGWTPLIWASGFGDVASLEPLLDMGANLEAADALQGATPLIHAARTGKVEALKILAQRGADLESADRYGQTALLAAAANAGGTSDKIQALIDAGAYVRAKDNRGLNALDLARKRTDVRAAAVIAVLEPLIGAETPVKPDEDVDE